MKRNHYIILLLVLIILTAVLTNPSQDKHREAMKNELKLQMEKIIKKHTTTDGNPWEKFGQALGMVFVGVLVDKIVDNLVTSENYIIFSITKLSVLGERKTVGFGMFGKVFIFKDLGETTNDFKALLDNVKQ